MTATLEDSVHRGVFMVQGQTREPDAPVPSAVLRRLGGARGSRWI